uniref:BED-type domain-containing protein n=1 Tax=Strigamia maritima TaxID=126957 RepID=T1ITW5_STRMM
MNKSEAWKFYERIDKDSAKCKKCNKIISCKGSNTTGLKRHVASFHLGDGDTQKQILPASDVNRDDNLPISSKAAISKIAKKLCVRLFGTTETTTAELEQEEILDENEETDLKTQLEAAIKMMARTSVPKEPTKTIQRELNLYAESGKLSENLQLLQDSLKTVQPTSTESERVFSISSTFCSKKRAGMSDHSLNVLCFLK